MAPHIHAQDSTNILDNEIVPTPEKKKGFTERQKKFLAAIAITAFFSSIVGGGIVSRLNKTDKIIDPSRPAVTDTANPGGAEKQPAIPDEAKNFVAECGSRYSDPVSTYYAEAAYEAVHPNDGAVLSDEYISAYKIGTGINSIKSELGFTMMSLPLDAKIDQKASMDVFNSYIAKSLDLYMNLIAKNPSPEAMAVIKNQFMNYCAGDYLNVNNNTSNVDEDTKASKLLDTVGSVVLKYGSSANYSVALASTDNIPGVTLFDKDRPTHVGHNDPQNKSIATGFTDNGIRLVINIDTYDDKNNIFKIPEIINDVQLSVERRPLFSLTDTSSEISFGQD